MLSGEIALKNNHYYHYYYTNINTLFAMFSHNRQNIVYTYENSIKSSAALFFYHKHKVLCNNIDN